MAGLVVDAEGSQRLRKAVKTHRWGVVGPTKDETRAVTILEIRGRRTDEWIKRSREGTS